MHSLVNDAPLLAGATPEALSVRPGTCFTVNASGATGATRVRQADLLIRSGSCDHDLVAWQTTAAAE